MNDKITNILVAGVGGQGVMTATEILAEAALGLGFDVKKTEVAGMAQRGGVVTSHLRFGKRVLSPQINAGEADILLAFEPAEGARWASFLRPDGVAMANTTRLTPPVVTIGLYDYPVDPIGQMRALGVDVYDFDAGEIARELGDLRLVNTVMLGAIADKLPFAAEVLKERIIARFKQRRPEWVDVNEQAFDRGRKIAQEKASATA